MIFRIFAVVILICSGCFFRGNEDKVTVLVRPSEDVLVKINPKVILKLKKAVADYETGPKSDRSFRKLLKMINDNSNDMASLYIKYNDGQVETVLGHIIISAIDRNEPLQDMEKELLLKLVFSNLVLVDEYSQWPVFIGLIKYLAVQTSYNRFMDAVEFFKALVVNKKVSIRRSILLEDFEEGIDDLSFTKEQRSKYWFDDFVVKVASNLAFGYDTDAGNIFHTLSTAFFYAELGGLVSGNDIPVDIVDSLVSKQNYSAKVPTAAELACLLNDEYGVLAFDVFTKLSDRHIANIRPSFVSTLKPSYEKILGEQDVSVLVEESDCKTLLKGSDAYIKEWLLFPEISSVNK